MRARSRIALLGAALALYACDRNLEPFDPAEQPREPDLSRIFPAGAERAERAEPGLPAAPEPDRGAAPVAEESGAPIHGTVQLAQELESRVTPGSVLFLIARRQEGGPPLAVKRIPAPRFPLDFELGPDDRMIQALPFAGPFSLTARVDSDGNAMSRTPGDLHGEAAGPFEPGAAGIVLVIDQVVPAPPQG
jgi:cytochrome c-type biogenesis protein CcmH